MTAAIEQVRPQEAEYRKLRDQLLAKLGMLPTAVYALAKADRHGQAIAMLRELATSARRVIRRPGKFAAEVAAPTEDTMRITRRKALDAYTLELHTAGPEQLGHLARMAEACCSTDLGNRMRDLVDHEVTWRAAIRPHLIPAPPVADVPQAGPERGQGLPRRVPPTYAAIAAGDNWPAPVRPGWTSSLGTDWWAIRIQRWEHAGRVGDPSDPEYDDVFYSDRGGEGGSF